ncbi:MAG: four-carbon acid sugar kinase family protein [Burkholderiales bacterium]
MRAVRTLIVADDLTGALDVAGPFAERGAQTWVVADANQDWAAQTQDAAVISVNADSRHLPAQAAAQRVAAILSRVDVRDRILIKKIDSTLRGQVVAETLAMMRASGRRTAIVAPAFPAQGRTVRAGVVYVKGVPLPQTSFAKDALSPPPLAPLHLAFSSAGRSVFGVYAGPSYSLLPFREPGCEERVLVIDSEDEGDLLRTVDSAGSAVPELLWVGSAGIAQALAQRCYPAQTVQREVPRAVNTTLVVVGSRAEQSHLQAQALSQRSDVVIIEAPNGIVDEAKLLACPSPVIVLRATPGPEGEGDPEKVAYALGTAAAKALRAKPIGAVIATGGDTARAILAATSSAALRVMGDLMTGIPYSQIAGPNGPWWLITKAGGFGTPSTLSEIVERLRL